MSAEVAVNGHAKEPEIKVWSKDPQNPALWLEPYTLGTPPLAIPTRTLASSPSPLISILENTVSVNSSALMVESLQGLMARMAWREGEEVRGLILTQAHWWEWRQ